MQHIATPFSFSPWRYCSHLDVSILFCSPHCRWLQSFRYQTAVLPILWFPQNNVSQYSQVQHRRIAFVIDAAVPYWLFYNPFQNLLSPKYHKEIPKEFLHLPAYPYLPNRAVIIFRSYWIQFSKWPLKGSDATESAWNDRLLQGH